jgi:hypothetical protein
MVFNDQDTVAEVRARMVNATNPSEDIKSLTCDLLDSGLSVSRTTASVVATFKFKPGTASIGNHQVKIILNDSVSTFVTLQVHRDEEKKIQLALDFNTLNIETPAVAVSATFTAQGFSKNELPTDKSEFSFSDTTHFDVE